MFSYDKMYTTYLIPRTLSSHLEPQDFVTVQVMYSEKDVEW